MSRARQLIQRMRQRPRLTIFVAFTLLVMWFVPWVILLHGSSITVERFDAKGKEVEAEAGPGTDSWVPLEKIPKQVQYAFVAAEDNNFYTHWGLDLKSIYQSMKTNLKKGRYVRGASTISQQLVKVAFLSQEKSLLRKVREAVGTLLLEATASKELIMTWYLNLIEFGPGIYGIKQAARHYFGGSPSGLSRNQGIQLALVLPNPKSWSAGLRRRSLTEFGQERFAAIVTNMRLMGFISTGEWQQSMATGNFGSPIIHYPKVFSQAIAGLKKQGEPAEPQETVAVPNFDENEDPATAAVDAHADANTETDDAPLSLTPDTATSSETDAAPALMSEEPQTTESTTFNPDSAASPPDEAEPSVGDASSEDVSVPSEEDVPPSE